MTRMPSRHLVVGIPDYRQTCRCMKTMAPVRNSVILKNDGLITEVSLHVIARPLL